MSAAPYLIIDLAAIRANYKLLAERTAPAQTGAVIKADAYGLGAIEVGKTLYDAGCRVFFFANLEEALPLRAYLSKAELVLFHGLEEKEYEEAHVQNVVPVLNSLSAIESYGTHAKKYDHKLPAFIHLDTGMNRLGLPPNEINRLIAGSYLLKNIEIKAWMSHLACSEEFSNPLTIEQRDRFKIALTQLPPAPASLCNSSGIFWGTDFVYDLARPGCALYGINPTPHNPNPVHDVTELSAPILQIRDVDTGMTVGYGATHRVSRKSRIATLALGYADGYLRALGGRGQVKIGEFLAPVVGRISMELTTVDITSLPENSVYPGMQAIVLGTHRPVDAIALEAGTNGYEIFTNLGSRCMRTYKGSHA